MSLDGRYYVVKTVLTSQDGKRSVELREFDQGETYLNEQEWVEGTTFANRHGGRLVGPFKSPEDAERFIVATDWFQGTIH